MYSPLTYQSQYRKPLQDISRQFNQPAQKCGNVHPMNALIASARNTQWNLENTRIQRSSVSEIKAK